MDVIKKNFFYNQFSVIAEDGGTPRRSAVITVNVNVIRETDTLRFTLDTYSVTIPETQALNVTVTTAFANPGVCANYHERTKFSKGHLEGSVRFC